MVRFGDLHDAIRAEVSDDDGVVILHSSDGGARLVHDHAAIGVTVEADAEVGLLGDHRLADLGQVRLDQRIRLVDEGARHVEVDREDQLAEALALGVDVIMLDNFDNQRAALAVQKVRSERPETIVELSGGIDLNRLPQLQAIGADVISMGALTHSAPSVDLGLDHLD